MTISNFLAAGPTTAIVQTAMDFFPNAQANNTLSTVAIPNVAFFFTTTSLLQGVGCFIWIPMANKFGRRPVYLASYALYLATAVWLIFEDSFTGFLIGRILMGLGAGAAETIAPVTIADIFFLHERGGIMAFYNCSLSAGVAFGLVISGLITINYSWRAIYIVASALIAFVLTLAIFTFPETAYNRCKEADDDTITSVELKTIRCPGLESGRGESTETLTRTRSYVESLRIYHGQLTCESWCKMLLRPFGLIILPPVLWAALVQAVTIGFLVAVTSNVDSAFEQTYAFQGYQVGLCFIASIIGSLIGIPAGGHLGDKIADYLTRRNGGIREPEMRLPALVLSLITTPLALVLYGVGIQHKLHWMCPTVGLGLRK